MNTDLPSQIAGSFQQGYQGAQDRTNVLAQRQQQRQVADMEMQNALRAKQDIEARRSAFGATNPIEVANKLRGAGLGEEALKLEQENREKMTQAIRNGAKSIAMSPTSYKSIFQRVKQTIGVPLDEDEKRYDKAFATGGEDAVRQLAAADAGLGMQVFGNSMYDPSTGKVTTPPKERVPTLMSPEEEAQKLRIARAGRSITAGGAGGAGGGGIDKVVTEESGRTRFFNKTGQEITPTSATGEPIAIQGKPSATFEKNRAQKQQLTKDIDLTINELSKITKEGGLIDQSTGSGAGRLIDIGARFMGQALPGDIAIAKLNPIADTALKMVPRFEGPQSDKDTASYKEAAGQLANASLPTEIRKAAGMEVLRLMKNRKNQFVTQNMADEGIAPSASGASTPAKPVNLPSGWSVEVN
jgi:hypothetical protein